MDPNPYKNPGLLIAHIRSEIEPKLLTAGFRLAGRSRRDARRAQFIEYARSDELLSVSWDQHEARLTAEFLTDAGNDLRAIATAEFSGVRSTSQLEERLAPFMTSVRTFVDGLREMPP